MKCFLTDLFNTSIKIIKDNKENLLSTIDELSKLKDCISKNTEINKKINKLDEEKKQDKTLKSTPADAKKTS